MADNLGTTQPAATAAPAQNQASQPQQFGLQNYNCIQSINHFASREYVNICNGNRLSLQKSPFELTGLILVVLLGAAAILLFIRAAIATLKD